MIKPTMAQTIAAIGEGIVFPILKVRLPFLHRLDCFAKIWILKALARLAYELHKVLHPPPPSTRPTLIKRYPCRPRLQTRIFLPPGREPKGTLSVFFCIHGGGFAVGNPHYDDSFCSMLARRTGMLVVSLDYFRAPLYPFPPASSTSRHSPTPCSPIPACPSTRPRSPLAASAPAATSRWAPASCRASRAGSRRRSSFTRS